MTLRSFQRLSAWLFALRVHIVPLPSRASKNAAGSHESTAESIHDMNRRRRFPAYTRKRTYLRGKSTEFWVVFRKFGIFNKKDWDFLWRIGMNWLGKPVGYQCSTFGFKTLTLGGPSHRGGEVSQIHEASEIRKKFERCTYLP